MDELAMEVAIARFNYCSATLPEDCAITATDLDESIANAVRAYLESDEVVERVARALLEATGDGLLWDHLAARGQSEYLADASAALQAAGGKQ